MKIALFHNFMNNIGGAEKVSLILAREFNADLYSTVANHRVIRQQGFSQPVRTIGWIPTNPPFRQQLASLRFRLLNLAGQYDRFLIVGDWALAGAVRNKPAFWYSHTPSRELWDLKEYTRRFIVPPHKRHLFDLWVQYNRRLNKKYIQHIQGVAASSHNAKHRLKTYLQQQAPVIYPPVDIEKYQYEKNGTFWLSVNRLVRYKRIELQLEAFRQMPDQQLVIVGAAERARHFKVYARYLREQAPANVTFLPSLDAARLRHLYATCRGFITTSQGEDFGLTAIEALAAGKPVIAPHEGGYAETLRDQATGLFTAANAESLGQAVRIVGRDPKRYREACLIQAQQFATARSVAGLVQWLAAG